MPGPVFVNSPGGQILSTLSANAQSTTDTVVTPGATAGFPTSPWFSVLVRETAELLQVTGINAGPPVTWTVVRGFGGSATQPIPVNAHLDYSITREMLLAGFVLKVDEQTLAADTTNGSVTLTVPSWVTAPLFRHLRVQWCGIALGVSGNCGIGMRFNGDSNSANYLASATEYSGNGTASFGPYGYSRTMYVGRAPAGASAYLCPTETTIELSEAFATDRWKSWHGVQRMVNGDQLTNYVMMGSGTWKSLVAISTIQIALDDAQNGTFPSGTLGAGFRASLYVVP